MWNTAQLLELSLAYVQLKLPGIYTHTGRCGGSELVLAEWDGQHEHATDKHERAKDGQHEKALDGQHGHAWTVKYSPPGEEQHAVLASS